MTGLGERHHLIGPTVGLHVNIQDIINVIEYRNLSDIVLVGHSYGGMIITGVAEAYADRIQRLIYFDGNFPEDGQSAWDLSPDVAKQWEERTAGTGTDWLVHPPDPAEKYGETGARADRQRDLMTPMAMWTHEEPIRLPKNRATELPRSYIKCTGYEGFQQMGEKARSENLDYYELKTHHNPIFYEPAVATEVLRSIVA